MKAPRVGLIGARRARQGLGPFFARDLVAAGAKVVAVLGRTQESAKEAAAAAANMIEGDAETPAATADTEAFFGHELDAVCVLTPAGTHGDLVEAALAHGCHVLAEKPFLWYPEIDWVERATQLEDRFAAAGLALEVNAQWPWTLPTLEEALGRPVAGARSLGMGMQPASHGLQMIGDAAPHPLSVAQAFDPSLTGFRELRIDADSENDLWIRGTLAGPNSELEIEIHLDGRPLAPDAGPRAAWISVDGTRVDRCIRPRDYALFFRRGSAVFDLPDPLTLRVADFVSRIRSVSLPTAEIHAGMTPDRTLSRRVGMLKSIADAFGAST
ncbi:Inositol 2-dehydrogenase/D-chiro-inositol 3-dehydrogenase [Planctomycetes bacterium Poly30]|uniref:Inositol 2-dehydrogenase/D-chiro-inositol 3-dehydrogenase n=1 Tax=Saltatorellus ferox TaxID=2528018 RepID=A0A518ENN5_9BACT|nr:Inositol 2-dehydrogenase/D-chiro-inositol 3-dehydrogenase [Planctomycetes bacterium Poly30]